MGRKRVGHTKGRKANKAEAVSRTLKTKRARTTLSHQGDQLSQTKNSREVEYFHAPSPNRYRCRFKSTCDDCFLSSSPCLHVEDSRLNLLIVGHNPSTDVWQHGYCYGNPTNRMWKLLTGTLGQGFNGVLPKDYDYSTQNTLPGDHGVGIASIATIPGNDANKITKETMRKWIGNFFGRLETHVSRVRISEGNESYVSPTVIAFEGKRHFALLYPDEPRNIPFGPLPEEFPLPPSWPFPRASCQIWILASSSGRAALSHAERIAPYESLARFLETVGRTSNKQ